MLNACFTGGLKLFIGSALFLFCLGYFAEHSLELNSNVDLNTHLTIKFIVAGLALYFLCFHFSVSYRFLVYFALITLLQAALEQTIREGYENRIKQWWFPGVHYDKEHDVFIDFNDYNNAYALARTVIVHPKNEGFFDWLKSKFGYHNWPKHWFEAIVRHEKGHTITLPFFQCMTAIIFDAAFNRMHLFLSPAFLFGAWTFNSWMSEMVADTFAGPHGIEMMSYFTKANEHHPTVVTGSFGVNAHPPLSWRFFAFENGDLLWPIVKHVNKLVTVIIGLYILVRIFKVNKKN